MKRTLFLLLAAQLISSQAFAGVLTSKEVLRLSSKYPETSLSLLNLLADRNLKDDRCDIDLSLDTGIEVLCNTDDNSVIAFQKLVNNPMGETPIVELRPDQQVPVGYGRH